MIQIILSLNIILLIIVVYILYSYSLLIEKLKNLQPIIEKQVEIDNTQYYNLALILVSIVIILSFTYIASNAVSESAIYKILKIADQKVIQILDYAFPQNQTIMKFVEKNTGLDVTIEIEGNYCIIRVLDYVDKKIKPLSEILIQKIESLPKIPDSETLDLAYKIWG